MRKRDYGQSNFQETASLEERQKNILTDQLL